MAHDSKQELKRFGEAIAAWRQEAGWSRPELNAAMQKTDLLPTKIVTAIQSTRLTDLIRKWEDGASWPKAESVALRRALRADPDDPAALPDRCRSWQARFMPGRRHVKAVESDQARTVESDSPPHPAPGGTAPEPLEAAHFLQFLDLLQIEGQEIRRQYEGRFHSPLNALLEKMVRHSLEHGLADKQLDLLASRYAKANDTDERRRILKLCFFLQPEKAVQDLPDAKAIRSRLHDLNEVTAIRAAFDAHEWAQPVHRPWSTERADGVEYFIDSLVDNLQRSGAIAEISALVLANLTRGFSMLKQGVPLSPAAFDKVVAAALDPEVSTYVLNCLSACISKCYLTQNPSIYAPLRMRDYLYEWAVIADGGMRRSDLPPRIGVGEAPEDGSWIAKLFERYMLIGNGTYRGGLAILFARFGIIHESLVPSYEDIVNDPETSYWLCQEALTHLAYYGGDRGQEFLLTLAKKLPGNPLPGAAPNPEHGFLAVIGAGNSRAMRELFMMSIENKIIDQSAIAHAVATKDSLGILRLLTFPWWRSPRFLRLIAKAMWRARYLDMRDEWMSFRALFRTRK